MLKTGWNLVLTFHFYRSLNLLFYKIDNQWKGGCFSATKNRSELEQGVISKDNSVKFISPINCVPKKNGTFRLVIDLRKLNSCVETCNFKYEDINSILEYVSPKDKLVTLDIKDGFYHVPKSPNSQQYMGFM